MKTEIIFPDTKKLHIDFLINYSNEFLKLNSLKVGDEIEIEFDYQVLRSGYKSREMNSYTWQKVTKGILKLDNDGCLYAESLDNFTFYKHIQVRGKYVWQSENRKSIKRFGTGFITNNATGNR